MSYRRKIRRLRPPVTFEKIRQVSVNMLLNNYTEEERDEIYDELRRGVAIVERNRYLMQYMLSYGLMHEAKLKKAFKKIKNDINGQSIEIIDYGAGQALASFVLLEYIRDKRLGVKVECITLIDPSLRALKRGKLHLKTIRNDINENIRIDIVNKKLEEIEHDDLETISDNIKIHLFSNILDIDDIRLGRLVNKIRNTQEGENYFVCVGPLNDNSDKIDRFYRKWNRRYLVENYLNYENDDWRRSWTIKARVFKVDL